MNMNDEEILEDFALTRNLKPKTKLGYKYAIKLYSEYNNKSLQELLTEAENEEEQGIRWKKRKLKKRLIGFRNYLNENYLQSSTKIHFTRIKTVYKHYEIEVHDLPKISNKNIKEATPINFRDLPDKDIIKQALKICNPVMRAIILFMTSSGCAKRETLNLTIQDFIDATSEYHNTDNIYEIIKLLKDRNNVVPTFTLKRQKTAKPYVTFCSPEASSEIMNYILSRKEDLTNEHELFKIGSSYFQDCFDEINETLNLGKKGTYNRFRSHMLRKFHASNLYNDGMSLDNVNALQGRSKDSTNTSYFMEDPNKLRQTYIEHMDAITINLDVNNIDFKSPEYVELESKYEEKKKQNENIRSQVVSLESKVEEIQKLLKKGKK